MEVAEIEQELSFAGYEDIQAGIINWPISVIRLTTKNKEKLAELADKILTSWRGYTDEEAFVYAVTDSVPHNTITPIARRRGENCELDLVLRNNITTEEHPWVSITPTQSCTISKRRILASSRSWALRSCLPA